MDKCIVTATYYLSKKLPLDIVLIIMDYYKLKRNVVLNDLRSSVNKGNSHLPTSSFYYTSDYLSLHCSTWDLLQYDTLDKGIKLDSSRKITLNSLMRISNGEWFNFSWRKNGSLRPSQFRMNQTNFYFYYPITRPNEDFILLFFKYQKNKRSFPSYLDCYWINKTIDNPFEWIENSLKRKTFDDGKMQYFEEIKFDPFLRIDKINSNEKLGNEFKDGDIIILSSDDIDC